MLDRLARELAEQSQVTRGSIAGRALSAPLPKADGDRADADRPGDLDQSKVGGLSNTAGGSALAEIPDSGKGDRPRLIAVLFIQHVASRPGGTVGLA